MISFFRFFKEFHMLVKLFLRWERNTIDSLKVVIGGLTKPVSCRILHDLETFNKFGGWDMGASAQINELTIFVTGDILTFLNLTIDSCQLKRIFFEHFKGFFFGNNQALELLICT